MWLVAQVNTKPYTLYPYNRNPEPVSLKP